MRYYAPCRVTQRHSLFLSLHSPFAFMTLQQYPLSPFVFKLGWCLHCFHIPVTLVFYCPLTLSHPRQSLHIPTRSYRSPSTITALSYLA